MDLDGPYGWKSATPLELVQIFERLREFERLTWAEIEQQKSCGPMEPEVICKEAQERLATIGLDTVGALFKLRVDKKARVWGYRHEHVFFVVWWDPEHKVYPMNIADN